MTFEDTAAKLKAHLAKRGYGDIEVKVSGGYSPNETAEDSVLIRAEKATLDAAGIAEHHERQKRWKLAGRDVHR